MNLLLMTLRADQGGGPKHVDQLISNLSNKYQIFIACPYENPYGTKWAKQQPTSNFFELPHRQFNILKFFRLIQWIRKNKITTIHSHGKGAGIYSRLAKIFIPSVRVIHTLHGLNKSPNPIKYFIFKTVEKNLANFTTKYIFVSFGEKAKAKDLSLLCEKKSLVIYNGIADAYINLPQKKDDTFKILSISRFDYQKNMDLAYEIAKYFKGNSKIKFIWVGDGEDRRDLQNRAENEGLNIEFTGFLDPFPKLYDSDIMLSTSRFEGLPYALIEACSVGKPIVASNVTGNNEVVENEYNGLLYNSKDEAINCIERLCSDDELMAKFGLNSRTSYLKNFTIDKMIDELIRVYETPEI